MNRFFRAGVLPGLLLSFGLLLALIPAPVSAEPQSPLTAVQVIRAYTATFCRLPETTAIEWWLREPVTERALYDRLVTSPEGQRVRDVRYAYLTVLGRDPLRDDCPSLRNWVDSPVSTDQLRSDLATSAEGMRAAEVRAAFRDILGRDPIGNDNAALRRWMATSLDAAALRRSLSTLRPLVGVHYFPWYQQTPAGWGNGSTVVRTAEGRPDAGFYDSGDVGVVRRHIKQMEDAGFDYVIINLPGQQPRLLENTELFFHELKGHRLKAAVMVDGLYVAPSDAKRQAVADVLTRFGSLPEYLTLDGQPVVYLFAAAVDFTLPGARLQNVYWTPHYDQGENTYNQHKFLFAEDLPFWSPTPQSLINGAVAVMPGYADRHLNREFWMEYDRKRGDLYREQWQRALSLHAETIIVYSWNEHFEESAIEPTDVWGNLYLNLSQCYIALAHQGSNGTCP